MSWSGLFISVHNFLDAANLPNWRADYWQSNQRCRHFPSGYSGGRFVPIRVSVGVYFVISAIDEQGTYSHYRSPLSRVSEKPSP
jgi:hypothetical protein